MTELAGATIVFDLDGTLVDSAPDLTRALNAVLALEGLPPADGPVVRRMVGRGARVLLDRAAARHGLAWPDAKLDALTETFVAIYASDIARATRPFPGVVAALDRLAEAGARLAVCTNKRTALSVSLLDALDLTHRFSAIVGADAVPERKPAAGHFLTTVSAAGGDRRRALMVGDAAPDVGAARSAGSPVIVYRGGYCEEDVDALGADVLISEFSELYAAVRRLI
jgi:phosphoglycolate phosphatase